MKLKIFIPEIRRMSPGFRLPFGYGFSYRAVHSFGSYYHLFPINLFIRFIKYAKKKKAKANRRRA